MTFFMTGNLSKYIDHTLLKPDAQKKDIIRLCREAREYGFMSVCVNPYYVPLARAQLAETDVRVCTVIGFPLGASSSRIKALETRDAVEAGAGEVDMVINIGALKDQRNDIVLRDIKAVTTAAEGRTVKVILSTGYLTNEEIAWGTRLACEAGADFVKTCTGFNDGAATAEHVKLMKENCGPGVRVKASSGIRSYEMARVLIDAGAERLGTSAGIAIVGGPNK
jgi:deoxyribose-phosphate aldolase